MSKFSDVLLDAFCGTHFVSFSGRFWIDFHHCLKTFSDAGEKVCPFIFPHKKDGKINMILDVGYLFS